MQRRKLLIGAGSGLTVFIAGCSDIEAGNESTESESPETEPETDYPEMDTDTLLERVAEDIESANDEIETESNKFSDFSLESNQGVNIETTTAENYLDEATAKLDAAEADASETQQQSIDAARSWISFARETTELLDLFADAFSDLETGTTYWDSERYADAADTFETAEETLREGDSQLAVVQDRQEQITEADSEAFSDVDLTSAGREAAIEQLDSAVTTLIPFANGSTDISLALEDFMTGNADLENEAYISAESAYEDSKDHAASAESTFKGAEDSAPNSLRNSLIKMSCLATGLKDAADHFAAAAEYLEAGNDQAANQEANEAQNELDSCDFQI